MRLALAAAAAVVLAVPLAHACADHPHQARHVRYPRQGPPASSSPAAPSSSPASPPAAPSASPPAGSAPPAPPPPPSSQPQPPPPPPPPPPAGQTTSPGSPPPATGVPGQTTPLPPPTTTFTFSLQSTNPTAVPLSNIVSTAATVATRPLDSIPSPGATPPSIPGAPPLPNAVLLNPANYPPLDRTPPIDSPMVQQWIQEVMNSGVPIPNFDKTLPGGCAANSAVALDPTRCWWTCSGCTRSSDKSTCLDKRHWGLTYDDGPAYYTPDLLHYLDEQKIKSTFFVVGSRCISFPQILQAQYMAGHHIAVHTWSHPSLTTLSNEEIIAELGWTKKVITDVLGVTPNMMRPPFGDIDDRVRAISLAMGLTPVMWTRINSSATYDTDDFNIHSGVTPVGKVLQNWQNILKDADSRNDGFIVLEHDLFQQSVEVATGYILPDALTRNLVIEPVITCLHQPLSNAYIETNDNKSNPPPSGSGAASILGIAPTTDGGVSAPDATGSASGSSAIATFSLETAGTALVVTSLAGIVMGLFTAL